jgi:hypothetical protein
MTQNKTSKNRIVNFTSVLNKMSIISEITHLDIWIAIVMKYGARS